MRSRRLLPTATTLATVLAAAAGTVVSGAAAAPTLTSAAAAPSPCPTFFPVKDLVKDQALSGLTVESGTTPAPFDAKVLGVLADGIAPGIPMIIVRTDSPAIERVGGIWYGMSGSPVYSGDGRLVGAVSYGLSFGPSQIAGLTPAWAMRRLLKLGTSTPGSRPDRSVALPRALRQEVVASGAASASEADGGLTQLQIPLGVSGLHGKHLTKAAHRLERKLPGTHVYAAGAVHKGTAGSPADIVPGGNFAVALSYGDLTIGGVGTTTAVCGTKVLNFGHPAFWTGASMPTSAHSADAITIQDDDVFGPYKLANLGGVVGTVDQDRIAGIRAVLGAGPATIPIKSDVASTDTGEQRKGATYDNVLEELPFIAAFHTLINLDRVNDRIGEGTAALHWVATGTRADGSPWRLERRNVFASQWDVTIESIWEMYEYLYRIVDNPYEAVTVGSVHVDGTVSAAYNAEQIDKVQVRQPDGTWVTPGEKSQVVAVAGQPLQVRVLLTHYRSTSDRTVQLELAVPSGMAGGYGRAYVTGGGGRSGKKVTDFATLLSGLRARPKNNEVTALLTLEKQTPSGRKTRTVQASVANDKVVDGYERFSVRVVKAQ